MAEGEKIQRYSILRINIEYYFIFIIVFILSIIGIVMVSSSSIAVGDRFFNDPYWFIRRQIIWWIISFIAFIILSRVNYRFYSKISIFLLLISIGLLALVLIPALSSEIGGARRWLSLAFFSIQPSELAKISLIIFICDSLNRKYKDNSVFKNILWPSFTALLVVTLLVFLEPDFGTTVIIWIVVFLIFFIGNVRFPHFLSLGFTGIVILIAYMFMEEYRRERIFAFFNNSAEASGVNFQVNQSLIALGSGNIFGLGLGNSVQKYSYLPEAHTDFIFAILGEEFGMIGTMIVIILFLLLALVGIRICLKTEDFFGRTLAGGITSLIIMQAVLNIAVVIGLAPVTGLTLPFISSGGSSLLVNMACAGILLNISRQNMTSTNKIDLQVQEDG